ncbi:MAG: efflux RND transporter permease subunit, partial [bacterium]
MAVIFVFLGTFRATLVPALTVPISVIASFTALYALGYSINLFTLLALVLAIGLIVDDTIVVVENIHRRIEEGEPPLVAAYRGAREVGFAVVATTVVLVAVFTPLAFLEGAVGRLFVEFAAALAAAVICSSVVALTLSPMLCSKILRRSSPSLLGRAVDRFVAVLDAAYQRVLASSLRRPLIVLAGAAASLAAVVFIAREVPREFAPEEDRGAFFVRVVAPEGASYGYMTSWMEKVEQEMLTLLATDEALRVLVRVPGSFNNTSVVNSGFGIVLLRQWHERSRSGQAIMAELRKKFAALPGVMAFAFMRQGLGRQASGRPVSFVIGGPTYEALASWRELLRAELQKNPGIVAPDFDYKETRPQITVRVDRDRAADAGVSYAEVARTLETFFAGRRVTRYEQGGEEYDVLVEGELGQKQTPEDLKRVYVRSATTGALVPLANLLVTDEVADAPALERFNRVRAITLEADLAPGYRLGEALDWLEGAARRVLPPEALLDYKGQSREYKESSASLAFAFILAVLVVFLVLAAQFESFIHPLVIMLTVPMALAGALAGLWVAGDSLNVY